MQYEVRWVAISQYHHDALDTKMTKEDARRMHVTLEREEYLAVCPDWCYGMVDGWAALVDLWLGQDAEWAAKSQKNRANRGTDGTHGQGNRNHFSHKKVQEEKLKRPLSDIEEWQIAHTRSKSKEGKCDYYGNSEDNLKAYEEVYLKVNPGTADPLKQATDERAVVGIGPKLHGRQAVLDAVCTPSISFTWLRATDPSLSQCTSTTSAQSHSLLAERHSAYMEYTRQETMAWSARVAAVQDHSTRMMTLVFEGMAAGTVPVMEPPPPPAGPQPVLLTFEEFLAQHPGTMVATGGSSVGGGAGLRMTPESRSPVTPIHRGGGGGGSATASSDDRCFGGDDLGGGGGRPGA